MSQKFDCRKFAISMKAEEAEILLYDQIGTSFWGDGISAKQFAEQFRAIGDKVSRINLRINSPGGDVWDGAAIYDLIKSSKVPVDVTVDGLAASAAFTVAMAGRKITIGAAGMMMMHNAKAFAMGDASDMRETADLCEKISNQMAAIYAKRCGMSLEEVKALMDAETWMTPDECVEMGCADEKMEPMPDEEDKTAQVGATFDLSKYKNVPEALKVRIAALALPKVLAASTAKNTPAEPAKEQRAMSEETKPAAQAVEVKEPYGPTAAAIMKLGKEFGVDVSECLSQEVTLDQAKAYCGEVILARAKENSAKHPAGLAAPTVESLTNAEKGKYSLSKAILSMAFPRDEQAPLEREVSADIAKRMQIMPEHGGILVPTNLMGTRPQMSGLDTKTNAAGKYGVQTEVRDLIELLRNKARVVQLGATVLSGLQGNLQFPTQASAGTLYWNGENPGSDVTQADATFGARTMSPKTCQALTSYSRQLLAQSTVDAEAFVRNDLTAIHALGIDLAAINGSGTSNQPLGLLKTSGIGSVAVGTNGGAPTYALIVDLETAVADANADEAGMKFLTTPVMRGKLKKVGKLDSTYASLPLWDQWGNAPGVGDLIGYQGYVSKQVPSTLVKGSSSDCHAIIFGYWPTVLVGEWGVIELVVDPYHLKAQGMIEVASFQMVDVILRQPAQMAAIQDARNV